MKKNISIAAICFLLSISVFAGQPLSETFEGYKLNSTGGVDVRNSASAWRAHDKNTIKISVVENPNKTIANPSDKAMKIERMIMDTLSNNKSAGRVAFRGAYTASFQIPLTEKSCIIEMKVLKKNGGQIGIRIYPDVEKTTAADYKIVTVNLQPSNEWQTARFDCSPLISLMTATPKFIFEIEKKGTVEAQKEALTVYIDDIKVVDK
jgi:hypothetical protein